MYSSTGVNIEFITLLVVGSFRITFLWDSPGLSVCSDPRIQTGNPRETEHQVFWYDVRLKFL